MAGCAPAGDGGEKGAVRYECEAWAYEPRGSNTGASAPAGEDGVGGGEVQPKAGPAVDVNGVRDFSNIDLADKVAPPRTRIPMYTSSR